MYQLIDNIKERERHQLLEKSYKKYIRNHGNKGEEKEEEDEEMREIENEIEENSEDEIEEQGRKENDKRDEQVDDIEDDEEERSKRKGTIYPLRITKHEQKRHVNLLLTEKNNNWHYSTIKRFNGLLRGQYSNHNGRYYYCYMCLHGFVPKKEEKTRLECKKLVEHIESCIKQKPQKVTYPKGKTLTFTNVQKQLPQPFVCYSDFECVLEKESDSGVEMGLAADAKKEIKYQTHKAASYYTKIVSIDPEFSLPENEEFKFPQKETYTGEDAAEHFLDYMQKVASKIYHKYIINPRPMIFTPDNEREHEDARECHICLKKFKETDCIVRDHCHILGVSIDYHSLYIIHQLLNRDSSYRTSN